MKFRRDNVGFLSCIFMMFCALLLLMFQLISNDFNLVIIVIVVLFVSGSMLSLNISKEYIYINEQGFSCKRNNVVLWYYDWNDVDSLLLVRSRWSRVYIVLKNSHNNVVELNEKELYIKYRFIVRRALRKYCIKKENSSWYCGYYIPKYQSYQSDQSGDG